MNQIKWYNPLLRKNMINTSITDSGGYQSLNLGPAVNFTFPTVSRCALLALNPLPFLPSYGGQEQRWLVLENVLKYFQAIGIIAYIRVPSKILKCCAPRSVIYCLRYHGMPSHGTTCRVNRDPGSGRWPNNRTIKSESTTPVRYVCTQ